jgi:hypothetical protein
LANAPFDTIFSWPSIDNRTGRFQQFDRYDESMQMTTLVINDIGQDDFRSFTCLAQSRIGHSEATIELRGKLVLTTFEGCSQIDLELRRTEEPSTTRIAILKRNQGT